MKHRTYIRWIQSITFLMLVFGLLPQRAPERAQALSVIVPVESAAFTTERISLAPGGTQPNGSSELPSVSYDGRFVAFESSATNLVAGDTNNLHDVFVADRLTGEITRVSLKSDGSQATAGGGYGSVENSISADGRFIAFSSSASDLVPGDTNNAVDVFVHDRLIGETRRVSVASDGTQGNSWSDKPVISADGAFVAFGSAATNLVNDDTNGNYEIFVANLSTGATTRVSVGINGTQSISYAYDPRISGDGRFIMFNSQATNLVPNDTNGVWWDAFVYDRQTGQTTLASLSSSGAQADIGATGASISTDGRYVELTSLASNLVADDTNNAWDAFIRDRLTGETRRISVGPGGEQGNADSYGVGLSADGRYALFKSRASNLVPDDTNQQLDIFVRDLQMGQTFRVPQTTDGTKPDKEFFFAVISGDGQTIGFDSPATNIVAGDTNNEPDIFVASTAKLQQPIVGLHMISSSPTFLGHTTSFTATISAGDNVVYSWNFGDGSLGGTGAQTSHTYTTAGRYTASVTARNSVSMQAANTVVMVVPYSQYLPFMLR